jgi:hypothetical protein
MMMRPPLSIVLLTLALGARQASAQHPLTSEQSQLIESARTSALQFSRSLPDFLCTEIVKRSEDPTDNNHWRSIDTLTVKVSYAGHEEYKLMARNGMATELDYLAVSGAISGGEFGTRLRDLFAPASSAQFAWKGWAHVRRRRVAVFTYRVAREHSRYLVQYESKTIVPGYHGEVSVDPESNAVMRITMIGDMPGGFAISACSSWTEYDYREVAGRTYLLPVESETRVTSGHYHGNNHIEFREYRKFQTDATITFK